MMFKENLAALPKVKGKKLTLIDEHGQEVAVIDNAPGTAGSFRVYVYLFGKYQAINAEAAQEGLAIYAEHSNDARMNPGKHPNIDRLLDLLQYQKKLSIRLI